MIQEIPNENVDQMGKGQVEQEKIDAEVKAILVKKEEEERQKAENERLEREAKIEEER